VNRVVDERGQAAVELALVLPVLGALTLGVLQVGLVVRDQVLVLEAAREAARAAAVDPAPEAASEAARAATALPPDALVVRVLRRDEPGGRVRVRVRYASPTDIPVIGSVLGTVHLEATAVLRVER
jgi:Flp pilus assembly protein TadG